MKIHMILGILISCSMAWVQSMSTLMCRGWPHNLKCPDSTQLTLTRVSFVPLGVECRVAEEKIPASLTAEPDVEENNCSFSEAFERAVSLCNGHTTCTLSEATLLSHLCKWPKNTMLRVDITCQKALICPKEIFAISTQRHSRNLHRRPAAWARDPTLVNGPIFLMPWARHGETRAVYEYSTLKLFVLGRPSSVYRLPVAAAGTSLVAYGGYLYYVKDRTRNLIKYSLQGRRKVEEKAIGDALYSHEILSTDVVGRIDIDLAIDEHGLWAIYTTPKSEGNLTIAHISMEDLSILTIWETDISKKDILNSFMICGNLYAINKQTRRVYKRYDTASGESSDVFSHINITMPWPETTSVNYNPRDNTLYIWSTSQAIMFTLDMKASSKGISNSAASGKYIHTTTLTGKTEISHITHYEVIEKEIFEKTTTQDVVENTSSETMNQSCPEIVNKGITWPDTPQGVAANNVCPDEARGIATWECLHDITGESFWDGNGPNFENCATWTIDIDRRLERVNSSDAIHEIALMVSDAVETLKKSESGLKGNDLQYAVDIIGDISEVTKLSSESKQVLNASESNLKKEKLELLSRALITSGSDLVDGGISSTWKQLNLQEKQEVGNTIMNTLEESAFLLVTQEEQSFNYSTTESVSRMVDEENILVGIHIQNMEEENITHNEKENIVFPDPATVSESYNWKNVTDSIQISSEDIATNQENGKTKIVFVMYDGLAELIENEEDIIDEDVDQVQVNSKIISATMQSPGRRIQLKVPAIITLQHIEASNESHTCVYWNMNSSEKWLTDGCVVVSTNWTHTVCSCNHLTSFAVLVNHKGFILDEHMEILDILTWVGLSASLACLALSILTFVYFRSLHCTRTTVHTNLCICLFLSQLIFLAGIDLYDYPVPCSIVAGILHYCFLATFVWMALEGFQLYVMLIEVFERNTSIVWYYLAGYGIPALFVALSAGLNPNGYGTETACWLKTDIHGTMGTIGGFTPFIWAFIGPASLVAVGNVAFLILTAVTMYRHGRKYIYYSKLRAIKSALRGTFALLCLLGTTWILGILWWWEGMIALQYLFCIFNAFQGVYIFVFHCLMHNKVRYEYRKLLSKCIGDNYSDLLNSSSLTMKYTGTRRRSTQIYQSQKRKSSSLKGSLRSTQGNEKVESRRGSFGTKNVKNFNDASKYFTPQDRATMQILLTRRESLLSPHGLNFPPVDNDTNASTAERHQRTFSTRSCPGKYPSRKFSHGSYHEEETTPLKRSSSERRRYKGRYNAPVSESVSRILQSAGSTRSVGICSQYPPTGESDESTSTATSSLPKDVSRMKKYHVPLSPPPGPNSPIKEFKLVDKRLAKFKKINSSPRLGRSSSLNGAEKKRRDLRKLQLIQPSTSVPDLMSQLSAKIESRDISQVLLMYLDKDGTLNREKMKMTQKESLTGKREVLHCDMLLAFRR